MSEENPSAEGLGKKLQTSRFYKVLEILALFLAAYVIIKGFEPLVGANLMLKQLSVWVANIVMLLMVWAGLKLRGESWADFGLSFKSVSWRQGLRTIAVSILVLVLGVTGFVLGSIIMANISGMPESADLSGYEYLKGNLGVLFLVLIGVYIVSSFGEEVIYRAFLINRISELGPASKTGTVAAVVLSSIIFGLAHYEWGPMGIVQTTFMGLALGTSYVFLKKRLWVLILAHAYMDTVLILQIYLAD